MTAAERKVRAAHEQTHGSPSCERTVAQWAANEDFRVYAWIDGERAVIGRGKTRTKAWADAASRLPTEENVSHMSDGYVDGGERVTRKPHPCAYCCAVIPAGTLTKWVSEAFEGRIHTFYSHEVCRVMDARVNSWDEGPMNPDDFRAVCEEECVDLAPFPWTNLPEPPA